ncbi:hypothetical protein HMH01_05705 [Halovulum dunhuangense]|uniref:Uncharacterized protein n=1 Tax=Halovulum dunhuangense TaxID=1505036 RepID=A0A849L0Z2_9RHOB|nr:hypothetical protein [Halovulum dunhuangense]NNU79930.1 hypothetical protein [Halovulum dunhuangense]
MGARGHVTAGLDPLLARLRAARRRRLLGTAARALGVGVTVAALAHAGATLAPGILPDGLGPPGLALPAAVLVALATLAPALLRGPSLDRLARRADRVLRTQERLATALEVSRHAPASPLDRALIADAAGHAALVAPASLADRRWRGWAVAALLALAIAAAAQRLDPPAPQAAPPVTPTAPEPGLRAADRAPLATRLDEAARHAAAEAARHDDPYLAAVARELAGLARTLATGETTASAAAAELSRLMDHVAESRARTGRAAAAADPVTLALEQALDRLSPTAPPAAAPQAAPAPATAQGPSAPENGPRQDRVAQAQADAPPTPEMSTARQGQMGGGTGADGEPTIFRDGDCVHDGDLDCFMMSDPTNAPSILLERQGDSQAQGLPGNAEAGSLLDGFRIGASARSGAGESFEAGQGTNVIGGGRTVSPDSFAPGAAVTLDTARRAADGGRIQVARAPRAAEAAPLPAIPGASPDWRRLPETAQSRGLRGIGQRDALAAYFRPDPEGRP